MNDLAIEGMKVAPPVAVAGASYLGMTPDQWLTALMIVYVLGLIAHQLPKHWTAFTDGVRVLRRVWAAWRRRWR